MSRILIVDDDLEFAEVATEILRANGHDVATAFNGREGLARIPQVHPELLIVDVMMPAMSGPGMLERLDEVPNAEELPVILVSALDEEAVREHTTLYDVFLRKPFDASALVNAVRLVLIRP